MMASQTEHWTSAKDQTLNMFTIALCTIYCMSAIHIRYNTDRTSLCQLGMALLRSIQMNVINFLVFFHTRTHTHTRIDIFFIQLSTAYGGHCLLCKMDKNNTGEGKKRIIDRWLRDCWQTIRYTLLVYLFVDFLCSDIFFQLWFVFRCNEA